MKIGLPKEIKNNENRVALTSYQVYELVQQKNSVFVELNSGLASGFTNEMYEEAGATLCEAQVAWQQEMIVKVKEPLASEYQYFYYGQIIFTYLHLAANEPLYCALKKSGVTAIAYETISVNQTLPLLRPMSEIAGRRAITVTSMYLEKINGGSGKLIGGVPGVSSAKICIIGGGIAGFNAAKMAVGLGARVTIIELNEDKICELTNYFKTSATVLKSNVNNINKAVIDSDVVISTILIPGDKAPKLVTKEMVMNMQNKSIIIDIAIDQGGSVETVNKISTHDDPIYEVEGVIHYAVANMPGAVPMTATMALTNATHRYVTLIANNDLDTAIKLVPELQSGINLKNYETKLQVLNDIFK